jgi:hypothetical protein
MRRLFMRVLALAASFSDCIEVLVAGFAQFLLWAGLKRSATLVCAPGVIAMELTTKRGHLA